MRRLASRRSVGGPLGPAARTNRAPGAALVACLALQGCANDVGEASEEAATSAALDTTSDVATTTLEPTADTSAGDDSATTGFLDAPPIVLHFGDDVAAAVRARVVEHVGAVADRPLVVLDADDTADTSVPGTWVLGFGDTPSTRALITADELDGAASETVIVRSGSIGEASALVTDARGLDPDPRGHANLGIGYGTYAVLEHLGFAFLHPLDPTLPSALPESLPVVDDTSSPRWPIRGLQLHTMHPLEVTDMLQGWGPGGPDDVDGWNESLGDWDELLEWLVANRQNRVHWILLWSSAWAEFGDSEERLARLATLVERAHEFGIWVGIDVPIRQHQQNTWRLVRTDSGVLEEELDEIRTRMDWLMQAGFDYAATESGTTEFTAPDDTRMLAWMDELARHLDEEHGRQAFIKIHTSSGQTTPNFVDPETGLPLNFNFLPIYADPRLGIMPHTVQHYGLDDLAPTYGNTDFAFMDEFMQQQAGSRPVVWHPETAYWVSFDVDVPLLLPVYAERRLADLRHIARAEDAGETGRGEHAGSPIDGQLTFSSGWEWGYWVQEVVTARAAWDPHVELDDDAALIAAFDPVVRPFDEAAPQVASILVRMAKAQRELLIEGRIAGQPPSDIVRRNGQAYLQGFEPFDDIGDLAQGLNGIELTMTQPERLGLVEMRSPVHDPPPYTAQLDPLLAEMETRFTGFADELEALEPMIPEGAMPLFADLAVGARVTALRARQIHALYSYVDGVHEESEPELASRLAVARDALDLAAVLVTEHESNYRVDPERIAGWRTNPTAYHFAYLWTVRSLYYWWRDEAKAVLHPVSPCYLNIIDPVFVGFGEGSLSSASAAIGDVLDIAGLGSAAECLMVPDGGPQLPPMGLRD